MNLGERYMGTHFITPETLLQDFFQNKTLEGIKLYAINLSEKPQSLILVFIIVLVYRQHDFPPNFLNSSVFGFTRSKAQPDQGKETKQNKRNLTLQVKHSYNHLINICLRFYIVQMRYHCNMIIIFVF